MKSIPIDISGGKQHTEKSVLPFFRSSVLPFFRSSVLPLGYNRKQFSILAVLCAFALSACFSPWKGDESALGEVRIGPGGGTALTELPVAGELAGMTYKVHFSGPGGSFDREFGPSGGVERLSPGSWRLTVKAYNNEPRLRGITDTNITIASGGSHTVVLESCIGIQSETELAAALGGGLAAGGYVFGHDITSVKGDLLVLEKDITLVSGIWASLPMHTGGPLTVIAEPGTTRVIQRSTTETITVPVGGNLTLGRAGEMGTLIVDNRAVSPAVINDGGAGTLHLAGNASIISTPTVTFDSQGGSSVVSQTAAFVTAPSDPVRGVYTFAGWFTAANGGGTQITFPYTPAANTTIYAKWRRIFDSSAAAGDFNAYLTSIKSTPGTYFITVTGTQHKIVPEGADDTPGVTLANGVSIILEGNGTIKKTASSTINGIFYIQPGTKLTLSGPTLDGNNGFRPVVNMDGGGEFIMTSGTITGANYVGGGSYVRASGVNVYVGTFTMTGGTITGNTCTTGGGVFMDGGGTFNLNSPAGTGNIFGNTASNSDAQVYIQNGTFKVNGVSRSGY